MKHIIEKLINDLEEKRHNLVSKIIACNGYYDCSDYFSSSGLCSKYNVYPKKREKYRSPVKTRNCLKDYLQDTHNVLPEYLKSIRSDLRKCKKFLKGAK